MNDAVFALTTVKRFCRCGTILTANLEHLTPVCCATLYFAIFLLPPLHFA